MESAHEVRLDLVADLGVVLVFASADYGRAGTVSDDVVTAEVGERFFVDGLDR